MINPILVISAGILLFYTSRLFFNGGKIKLRCPSCNGRLSFSRINILNKPIACPECQTKLTAEKKSYLLIVVGFSVAWLPTFFDLITGLPSKPDSNLKFVFDVIHFVALIVCLVGCGMLKFIPCKSATAGLPEAQKNYPAPLNNGNLIMAKNKSFLLLVCLSVASFCPMFVVPLIKELSRYDLPLLPKYLVASLVPGILAMLFSTVAMIYKGANGNGVSGVIKFSLAYVVTQYLITVCGLLAMEKISSLSALVHITAFAITFLNALVFALLIQPLLGFTLRHRAALLVAFVTTASWGFCMVFGFSWFWRFSAMGVVTAMVIVSNLTRRSSTDALTRAA